MSRTLESSLQALLALSQGITSDFTFLADPNIPGGTIDPASWGITFPLGLWTSYGHSQVTRESGEVGNLPGKDNRYLLRLLTSQYQNAAGRIASRADEFAFYDKLKDAISPPNGNPCFSGVISASIEREQPDYLLYGSVQYIGSFIVVSLVERY